MSAIATFNPRKKTLIKAFSSVIRTTTLTPSVIKDAKSLYRAIRKQSPSASTTKACVCQQAAAYVWVSRLTITRTVYGTLAITFARCVYSVRTIERVLTMFVVVNLTFKAL